MKKIRTMRAAALLLVLTLMTSCFVGGTFAKYTSTASGTGTATVAKWDIKAGKGGAETLITSGETFVFDLFGTINDTGNTADETDVADTKIAPGTAGSFELSIKNDSEVNAEYTVTLAETNAGNVPLQYSVDNTNWKDSIAELVMTDLADQTIGMNTTATETVYWRWAFDNTGAPGTYHAGQDNASDTALGKSPVTVSITATLTVEQVD